MKNSGTAEIPVSVIHDFGLAPVAIPASISRRAGLLTLLASAMSLAGCGGGGGTGGGGGGSFGVSGVSSGGTGSVSVGSVTGFGSIIVNSSGVRIDDSSATTTDEDGVNLTGRLRLGMQVVDVSSTTAAGAVTAQSIVAGGELLGRIEGVPDGSPGKKIFVVLGQTVQVVGGTVFDASLPNGFASLASDDMVEVHGLVDARRNVLTATFIEKKTSASYFKILGLAKNYDAVAKTFRIDNLRMSFSGATDVRVEPINDTLVRVRLASVLPGNPLPAVWSATRISGSEVLSQDRESFEIEARISAFTSATSFAVNGVPVNASAATFDNGTAGLAQGALVEVKGRLTGGTVIASRVKLEGESQLDQRDYELHGTVSNKAGNAASGTFTLLGLTIEYNNIDTQYSGGGSVANLVDGARVEVKGLAAAASVAGTRIAATSIKFE